MRISKVLSFAVLLATAQCPLFANTVVTEADTNGSTTLSGTAGGILVQFNNDHATPDDQSVVSINGASIFDPYPGVPITQDFGNLALAYAGLVSGNQTFTGILSFTANDGNLDGNKNTTPTSQVTSFSFAVTATILTIAGTQNLVLNSTAGGTTGTLNPGNGTYDWTKIDSVSFSVQSGGADLNSLNGNTSASFADLVAQGSETVNVPEPTSLSLAALGAGVVLFGAFRRRAPQ
jgi:hypothetical protein